MGVALFFTEGLHAVDRTWTGAGADANWATTANWNGGTLPTSIDTAAFSSGSATIKGIGANGPVVVSSGAVVNTISFRTGGYYGGLGYTIGTTGGNSIAVTSGGGVEINSNFTGSNITQAVNAPLTLLGSATFANNTLPSSGNILSLGGSITSSGASVLNLSGVGKSVIAGDINGATGVTLNGGGDWTFSGTNTMTGQMNIWGGTLTLDYSTNNTNKLSSGVLYLSESVGAHLKVIGNNSASTTQNVTSTTIASTGATQISVSSGSGQTTTLNLGAITRNSRGILNVNLNNVGGGTASVSTTSNVGTGNILGGWATVNGTDWATKSGNNIVALSSYSNDTFGAGLNTNITQSGNFSGTTNTLRFNTNADTTVSLSGAVTLQSGGILVTNGVGNKTSTITGGNFAAGELNVIQNNTLGDLDVATSLVGNTTVVKAGKGNLILSGNNTFTNGVIIQEGTLTLGSNTALGATNGVNLNGLGATLDMNGYSASVGNISNYRYYVAGNSAVAASGLSQVVTNSAAGTVSELRFANANAPIALTEASGAILSLTKTGTGDASGFGDGQVLPGLTNSNYFILNGDITVEGGIFRVRNSDMLTTGVIQVNTGATLAARLDQQAGVIASTYLAGSGAINMLRTDNPNGIAVSHNGSVANTFTGNVLGNTNLVANGAGKMVFTNALDFSGGTRGALFLNNTGSVETSAVTSSGNDRSIKLVGTGSVKLTSNTGVVAGTGIANGASGGVLNSYGGTLWIAPSGSGLDASVSGLTATNGSLQGAQFRYAGGGTLLLDKGSNNSVTFTIGNAANTSANGLFRETAGYRGTLVISATGGLGAGGLGDKEKFLVQGASATSLTPTNGILAPSIVAQDFSSKVGSFVTYDSTSGFKEATYSGTDFTGVTSSSVIKLTTPGASLGSATSVYALRNDTSMSNSSTLTIAGGGLILNNGTISGAGTLTTGSTELLIYTSGVSTVQNTIAGSVGLTLFGPGTLVLSQSANMNYSGQTTLNSGVLDVNGDVSRLSTVGLHLRGGVLQGSGTFTRSLGTGTNQVNWVTNSGGYLATGGGFAARGGDLTVAIGGTGSPTNLVWGSGARDNTAGSQFISEGGVLMFGSTTADHMVDFKNNIDLGLEIGSGSTNPESGGNYSRVVDVADNVNSTGDFARISGVISSSHPYHGLVKDGEGLLELTGTNTYVGSTTVNKGTLRISRDANLGNDPDAAYAIVGTTTQGSVIINGAATLEASDSFALSSTRSVLLASGASGATASKVSVADGKQLTFNGKIGNYVGEVGSLDKTGTGVLVLGGTSEYTGTTKVSAGTLVVNGSIASSSGVEVAAGASLGGHGRVGALSGAGLVGPGNSPGILTATEANGTGGLDFAFEFTLANVAPVYGNASASGNDVLRLTNSTPFVASLNSGNEVALYLNVGAINLGDSFYGGFYVDSGDFFSSISGAQYAFFIADASGSFSYGGQTYSLYTGGSISVSAVAQTADFGQGDINGYVMKLEVVPEPSTWLLLGLGFGALLLFRRRGIADRA